jgi:hypothetical protein
MTLSPDIVIMTRAELEYIKNEAFQKGVRRGRFEEAVDKSYIHQAAQIARGDIYHERYRTWPFWEQNPDGTRGNRANDSALVIHCDKIAGAITELAYGPKEKP